MSAIRELVRGTPPAANHCARKRCASLLVVALGAGLAGSSWAGLGEPADSVLRDHAALHGTALTQTPMGTFDVHEITTRDGTQVRAYVSRDGSVFATTWVGPALPDLKVVLGARYSHYAAGVQSHPGGGKVFGLNTDEIVLRIVKLPRGLAGSALVPGLLPPGTSPAEIR